MCKRGIEAHEHAPAREVEKGRSMRMRNRDRDRQRETEGKRQETQIVCAREKERKCSKSLPLRQTEGENKKKDLTIVHHLPASDLTDSVSCQRESTRKREPERKND